jgi:hypothetical protein
MRDWKKNGENGVETFTNTGISIDSFNGQKEQMVRGCHFQFDDRK